jgi:hypothetical protein
MTRYKFFLGGKDLEMVQIRDALNEHDVDYVDAGGLNWGAKASAYGAEAFADSERNGFTPVLVELEIDCDLPETAIIIDHHNERSHEPASLLQVLNLLEQEPTRWDELVAANDAGYIPAMLAISASEDEVAEICKASRSISGITPEMEAEAEAVIEAANAHELARRGELVIIRMAHSKCATITDRLFPLWKDGRENLLVLSEDGEANFFGRGDICVALKEKFDGWSGGSGLGDPEGNAFWGGNPSHETALAFIGEQIGG